MIFLLDNYDSFTYNLYQYLSELGEDVVVDRNDKTTVENIAEMQPEKVVISPGPSNPANAGISKDVARYFGEHGTPVLGVCLGHQCIGEAFGGTVAGAGEIMHGKSSMIYHDEKGIYEDLPNPFDGHPAGYCAGRVRSNIKDGQRRCDGRAAPRVSHCGNPVPSGEHTDGGRQRPAPQFPEDVGARTHWRKKSNGKARVNRHQRRPSVN